MVRRELVPKLFNTSVVRNEANQWRRGGEEEEEEEEDEEEVEEYRPRLKVGFLKIGFPPLESWKSRANL